MNGVAEEARRAEESNTECITALAIKDGFESGEKSSGGAS